MFIFCSMRWIVQWCQPPWLSPTHDGLSGEFLQTRSIFGNIHQLKIKKSNEKKLLKFFLVEQSELQVSRKTLTYNYDVSNFNLGDDISSNNFNICFF